MAANVCSVNGHTGADSPCSFSRMRTATKKGRDRVSEAPAANREHKETRQPPCHVPASGYHPLEVRTGTQASRRGARAVRIHPTAPRGGKPNGKRSTQRMESQLARSVGDTAKGRTVRRAYPTAVLVVVFPSLRKSVQSLCLADRGRERAS